MTNSFVFLPIAAAVLALPLWPAIQELRNPSDAKPLNVFQGNAADVQDGLQSVLPQFFAHPEGRAALLPAIEAAGALVEWVGTTVTKESFTAPRRVFANAVAVSGAPVGTVSLHAPQITVEQNAQVGCNLQAHEMCVLELNSVVQVVQAALIQTGAVGPRKAPARATPEHAPVDGATYSKPQGWWRSAAEAKVPESRRVAADIIAQGKLTVGQGAVVAGSLKSYDTVEIQGGSVIVGNVVGRNVILHEGVVVLGSVLADEALHIASNCEIGSPTHPCTVAARTILVETSVWVHGGLSAYDYARVVQKI